MKTNFVLTDLQSKAIKKTIINTNSTVVSLKTGGGKTYIFKVAQIMVNYYSFPKTKVAITITL